MGKCFITKLNGSVSDPDLLKLGEMRIKITKVNSPTANTQNFSLLVVNDVTLEIIGDGYFTDSTLVENKGKILTLKANTLYNLWISNNDSEIAILDKYSVKSITLGGPQMCMNIENFKYSKYLDSISTDGTQTIGDIANLKNLSYLRYLKMLNTNISGDIGTLKNLESLTYLAISNKINPLIGNVGDLISLTNCTEIKLLYCKLSGDLASLPASCRFISLQNDKGSIFTWGTRPSTAKIFAIEGASAKIDNLDKMLQNLAQCQVGFIPNDKIWYKIISVAGNRTTASDDAVVTLQQKGYTVSISKV